MLGQRGRWRGVQRGLGGIRDEKMGLFATGSPSLTFRENTVETLNIL